MAVDEAKYRRLRDMGFSHPAALAMAEGSPDFSGGGEGGGAATISTAHFSIASGSTPTVAADDSLTLPWKTCSEVFPGFPPNDTSVAIMNPDDATKVVFQQAGTYLTTWFVNGYPETDTTKVNAWAGAGPSPNGYTTVLQGTFAENWVAGDYFDLTVNPEGGSFDISRYRLTIVRLSS